MHARLFDAVPAASGNGATTGGNGKVASDNGMATDNIGTTTDDSRTALSAETGGAPIATVDPTTSSDTGATPLAEASGEILPDGLWRILLPPQEAGGPYTLEIGNLTGSRPPFPASADAEMPVCVGRRLKCARVHVCSPASSITNWLR